MTRIDMTTREWHELVKPVIPHAGTDKDLPELAVVRLESGTGAVYAVATDRHSIAAERWPLPSLQLGLWDQRAVHVRAGEAAASLKLFTYSKDEDPPLHVTVDDVPVPVGRIGQQLTLGALAVTLQSDDGTRLVLHDVRAPARDPLAGWRKQIRAAMTRPRGRALEGLDLRAAQLARWTAAARGGERLCLYSGPEPGDPLLITVETHFAGLWKIPQYLDGPGKTLGALPWGAELDPQDGDDVTDT